MTHKPTPQSFPVDHQSQMIRRLPSNHPLMIEVDARGRQAVLRDLGSLNGCFINNVRIRNQREVLSHARKRRCPFHRGGKDVAYLAPNLAKGWSSHVHVHFVVAACVLVLLCRV